MILIRSNCGSPGALLKRDPTIRLSRDVGNPWST
jgi:hypothetical protein